MEDETQLKHYGVVGMRWGRRKNASATFAKASKKANKLNLKSDRANRKVDKFTSKVVKYSGTDKEEKYANKLDKAKTTAQRKQAKADKWMNEMAKTFRKTKISEISYEDLSIGKDYVPMLKR